MLKNPFKKFTSAVHVTEIDEKQTPASQRKPPTIACIPEALSFENVIAGNTKQPATCADFMSYLLHVERTAENLQFYLWYLDYSKRFNDLPARERVLSGEFQPDSTRNSNAAKRLSNAQDRDASLSAPARSSLAAMRSLQAQEREIEGVPDDDGDTVGQIVSVRSPSRNSLHRTTSRASQPRELSLAACPELESLSQGFPTSPTLPPSPGFPPPPSPGISSTHLSMESMRHVEVNHQEITARAFETADTLWQPFSVQPCRDEISQTIATYFVDGAPRELNISFKERNDLLHSLQSTTHPSALLPAVTMVEKTLRQQSHPNFIQYSLKNGNAPRISAVQVASISSLIGGILMAILFTLSREGRWYRAIAIALWVPSLASILACQSGICLVSFTMGQKRQLNPWELTSDTESQLGSSQFDVESNRDSWDLEYEKKAFIQKMFDKEVEIQDPTIKHMQTSLVLRAHATAIAVSVVLAAIFVPLPRGGFF